MPRLKVDSTRDAHGVGLWHQGTNSGHVGATYNADACGALQGLAEDGPATGCEQPRVEVIATQERHQRYVEPGSVGRSSEQRYEAAEGHYVRQGLQCRISREQVPQTLQGVWHIVLQWAGEIAP